MDMVNRFARILADFLEGRPQSFPDILLSFLQ